MHVSLLDSWIKDNVKNYQANKKYKKKTHKIYKVASNNALSTPSKKYAEEANLVVGSNKQVKLRQHGVDY